MSTNHPLVRRPTLPDYSALVFRFIFTTLFKEQATLPSSMGTDDSFRIRRRPKLTSQNPLLPSAMHLSNSKTKTASDVASYQFGRLSFAADWEVNRVAEFMSVDLALFGRLLLELKNADDYTVFWNELQAQCTVMKEQAENIGLELRAKRYFLPSPSSTTAWELLRTPEGRHTGRAHFKLSLECSADGRCTLSQHSLKAGQSRRAYRKFGSDRFLTLSFDISPKNESRKPIEDFLKEPFKLCGRRYRAFAVKKVKKDKNLMSAHCFAFAGIGLEEISMSRLLEWLISPKTNQGSTISKLYSRITLSLSSTLPTVAFAPHQIRVVQDIKSSIDECMTDGCGKASPAVFREIKEILGLEQVPAAVQGRLGGAKGVWYVDPEADPYCQNLWIELKESQIKYEYPSDLSQERTLCTLVSLL